MHRPVAEQHQVSVQQACVFSQDLIQTGRSCLFFAIQKQFDVYAGCNTCGIQSVECSHHGNNRCFIVSGGAAKYSPFGIESLVIFRPWNHDPIRLDCVITEHRTKWRAGPIFEGNRLTIAGDWIVSGSVGHWGHVHQRTNGYRANLEISEIEGVWKLTGLEILEEQRL